MTPVRVLVVEDHPIVVSGIRHLLAGEPGCEVVADVPDVAGAMELLGGTPAPDIAIVDIALRSPATGARESGLDVVKWIVEQGLPTRVIVLSMYDEPAYVLAALNHQVAGYVTKGTDLAGVVKAVRSVREGRQYLSESLVPIVTAAYQARARGVSLDPYDLLSPRERELVSLIGQGIGIRDAAKRMRIVPRSAHQYRASIMRKTGISTYEQFAQWTAKRVHAASTPDAAK
jgi:DNA-binding NarL/FixJ family response regulator